MNYFDISKIYDFDLDSNDFSSFATSCSNDSLSVSMLESNFFIQSRAYEESLIAFSTFATIYPYFSCISESKLVAPEELSFLNLEIFVNKKLLSSDI